MLAIAGGKGGCGKTTIALGVGQALGTPTRPALVVDTDRDMPNLHRRAGVNPSPGITDVTASAEPTAVAQRATAVESVDVLPCQTAAGTAIDNAINRLSRPDRPVVLDCPAGAGPDAARPLRGADRTVLVSTPTRQSLTDTAKTAAMARALDAPPALTVLVGSDGSVDPSTLLCCPETIHVPSVSKPLESDRARARYVEIADVLTKRNT
ncbi:CDP-4-dehydro-6-deoxy-D-gulose 4-reductase [Haloarcula taiwanensis]|uniref:CDP-4-dehydro-6-deoxy-D-gulose 4-reductase n=1 Tax=Haloarcula taiwanensis TaxID=1932004 RepID=A0A2H4ZYU5_9EURY|nr:MULTISPECIES: CDP-4-dehydro-6-deoxy-D-gulose 4-reductase [Haloarcula]AUG47610.1 CDP-4-dehydro-6-deoxy-D-gulose 4-reductase [Haloarcula taiwanensis]RLM33717.1 CDP-4-dehydro-6-deoxy-D-gulose 4-reductase [Haloarcula sp. Atlit-120R]RLM42723.1 CDP-4-dehydro-6-deoxy-D-gulose 4-reductase [Haloarcula sp. Atlit-47R]